MTRPSREFLIGQAVLDAALEEWPDVHYLAAYLSGRSRMGRQITPQFMAKVITHFRRLEEKYHA
jgi:hypothetical protein